MNAADFFLVQHGRLHAAGVGDPASMWERVFGTGICFRPAQKT